MIKFLLWLLFFILLYNLLKNIFTGNKNQLRNRDKKEPQVQGRAKTNPPLDLSKMDVEDANYEEMKEDKKDR